MLNSKAISRRYLFWAGTGVTASLALSNQTDKATVWHFATAECYVQMSIEFQDRVSETGFRFKETSSNRHFCLSAKGDADHHCLPKFSGSLAIARYQVEPRRPVVASIREYVRTIDGDGRIPLRPPFERTISFERGVASDIQAFGVETNDSAPPFLPHDPWCIVRQDLFFFTQTTPFLTVHWKHAFSAIRLLDIIPGDQTQVIDEHSWKDRRR